MKAIGYVRVSTDKQADKGVSLEAQTAKVQAMAVVQEAELVDVIVDAGESAKSLQRPGMAQLLDLVDRKAVDETRASFGRPHRTADKTTLRVSRARGSLGGHV